MKKFLIIVGIFIVLVLGGLVGGYVYVVNIINNPQGTSSEWKEFVIQPGESSSQISQRLEAVGIIKNAEIFQFYLWREGITSKIKTGSFSLSASQDMNDIASMITGIGKNPDEVTVTLIEGQWRAEIGKTLESKGLVSKAQFVSATESASKYAADYAFLQGLPKNASLEGFLFPDTYIFSKKNTAEEIVRKMLDNFGRRTRDLQTASSPLGFSFYQNLTFASILQAEASKVSDLGLVAGVFENRINASMKFQSDATLHFIFQDRTRRITITDTKTNNPYNLYQNAGLTPGPINSPGLDALRAALKPTESDYYYFLATSDGTVIYSKTGAEHNAAKARYLQ